MKLKAALIGYVVCCLGAAVVLPFVSAGCISPPSGTVFVDFDNDGKVDGLAWDRNADGQADIDEVTGKPAIIPGSTGYKIGEAIDSVIPDILIALGGATGIPILIGVGAAWKGAKFGRIFNNTVMSVQVARQRLKDKGLTDALDMVDDALSNQLPKTAEAIEKAKIAMGLPSVTDGT